ncbi:ubiquitin carboxyl-terminal hydrolase [Anaeramoeba flamelloides]|uniref:ubiquitinyl hydrolase 1 n=1 Tax=Anaeramoeba flamelloides TaxID=1746091 RepID=A0AAV7YDL3_9EUKA|nr:ubiquitin carboxyl-terminal hydrolase [Anaeramoeba flamelloides]
MWQKKKLNKKKLTIKDPLLNQKFLFAEENKKGLKNYGQTCYINSVLQCLTYLPKFSQLLLSKKHSQQCTKLGFCILCSLEQHVYNIFYAPEKRNTSLIQIVNYAKNLSSQFEMGRKGDPYDFLIKLLECASPKGLESVVGQKNINYRLINSIFRGELKSCTICSCCGNKTKKHEQFFILSLEINKSHSLHTAIKNYLRKENKHICKKCKQKQQATKQLTIKKFPLAIVFHLKRYTVDNQNDQDHQRIGKRILFPTSFKLNNFISGNGSQPNPKKKKTNFDDQGIGIKNSKNKDKKKKKRSTEAKLKYSKQFYDLKGVIVHEGTNFNSGNFYSLVKTRKGNWFKMKDSKVTKISKQELLQQNVYILIYQLQTTTPKKRRPLGKFYLKNEQAHLLNIKNNTQNEENKKNKNNKNNKKNEKNIQNEKNKMNKKNPYGVIQNYSINIKSSKRRQKKDLIRNSLSDHYSDGSGLVVQRKKKSNNLVMIRKRNLNEIDGLPQKNKQQLNNPKNRLQNHSKQKPNSLHYNLLKKRKFNLHKNSKKHLVLINFNQKRKNNQGIRSKKKKNDLCAERNNHGKKLISQLAMDHKSKKLFFSQSKLYSSQDTNFKDFFSKVPKQRIHQKFKLKQPKITIKTLNIGKLGKRETSFSQPLEKQFHLFLNEKITNKKINITKNQIFDIPFQNRNVKKFQKKNDNINNTKENDNYGTIINTQENGHTSDQKDDELAIIDKIKDDDHDEDAADDDDFTFEIALSSNDYDDIDDDEITIIDDIKGDYKFDQDHNYRDRTNQVPMKKNKKIQKKKKHKNNKINNGPLLNRETHNQKLTYKKMALYHFSNIKDNEDNCTPLFKLQPQLNLFSQKKNSKNTKKRKKFKKNSEFYGFKILTSKRKKNKLQISNRKRKRKNPNKKYVVTKVVGLNGKQIYQKSQKSFKKIDFEHKLKYNKKKRTFHKNPLKLTRIILNKKK